MLVLVPVLALAPVPVPVPMPMPLLPLHSTPYSTRIPMSEFGKRRDASAYLPYLTRDVEILCIEMDLLNR